MEIPAGTVLECREAVASLLTVGQKYTVVSTKESYGVDYICVQANDGRNHEFFQHRFDTKPLNVVVLTMGKDSVVRIKETETDYLTATQLSAHDEFIIIDFPHKNDKQAVLLRKRDNSKDKREFWCYLSRIKLVEPKPTKTATPTMAITPQTPAATAALPITPTNVTVSLTPRKGIITGTAFNATVRRDALGHFASTKVTNLRNCSLYKLVRKGQSTIIARYRTYGFDDFLVFSAHGKPLFARKSQVRLASKAEVGTYLAKAKKEKTPALSLAAHVQQVVAGVA